MPKHCKKLLLALLVCSVANVVQSMPILLNSGDSAIFKFDFSPMNSSAANGFAYTWNTTLADGSSIALFEMSFSLFDELGEAPILSYGPDSSVPDFQLSGIFPTIADDPLSYLVVNFFSADGIETSSVLMSITAEAYQDGELVADAIGVASKVPAPATIALFSLALAGLSSSRVRTT
jgi:hypothetical protein